MNITNSQKVKTLKSTIKWELFYIEEAEYFLNDEMNPNSIHEFRLEVFGFLQKIEDVWIKKQNLLQWIIPKRRKMTENYNELLAITELLQER